MKAEYADLELGLHRRDAENYGVELRFNRPDSETDVRIGQDQPTSVSLDLDELSALAYDPAAYGEKLTQALFADAGVQTGFAQARASVESLGAALRVRLTIGPSAPELHAVRWETLRDPQDNSLLTTNQNILFSRYLSSRDWRPVQLRAQADLRCLTVIANPTDLAEYNLAPVDVDAELQRAERGLGDIPVTALGKGDTRASLQELVAQLQAAAHDVLYVVCHGSIVKEEPWLWLEDDQGAVERVSGVELVRRLNELTERPRLIVLASCESAGDGSGEALAALGPRLAEAGIPAVLAMQGKISMETVALFMPVFFEELSRDGQIDRALAVARGAVRDQSDYWMPALFMRLRSGRIWYVPGFGLADDDADVKWRSLTRFIEDGIATPVVGPGVAETLIGSRQELARQWAEEHGFPLARTDADILPQVAQYVVTHESAAFLPIAVRETLQKSLIGRFKAVLPAELLEARRWSLEQLSEAFDHALNELWGKDADGPYQLLARLKLPIYITTERYTDLMARALRDAGAEPEQRIARWNERIPIEKATFDDTPTPERPLVYNLLGHISVPGSVVMAEDHYFDYLIGITRNKDLIPSAVRAAMSSSALLFVGFGMNDWEFRIFFRILMGQEGAAMLRDYSHATAQMEPDEDRIVDLERARGYLSDYFEAEHIGIFWGNPAEFMRELWQRMEGQGS